SVRRRFVAQSGILLEPSLPRLERAPVERVHRGRGTPHARRGFLGGEALELPQAEHAAVLGREREEGAREHAAPLSRRGGGVRSGAGGSGGAAPVGTEKG